MNISKPHADGRHVEVYSFQYVFRDVRESLSKVIRAVVGSVQPGVSPWKQKGQRVSKTKQNRVVFGEGLP
jgi:hypothetical protein